MFVEFPYKYLVDKINSKEEKRKRDKKISKKEVTRAFSRRGREGCGEGEERGEGVF